MSGIWLRCPNCGLETKVELTYRIVNGHLTIDPDISKVEDHARNCEDPG